MNEFIKKLIQSFEREKEQSYYKATSKGSGANMKTTARGENLTWQKAIEIVNQLAEETSVYRVPLERGEWIPVSERLPEKGKAVLTCTKDGWISVNINMSYNGKKNEFECGYYTAWMPLPAPYQTKGE